MGREAAAASRSARRYDRLSGAYGWIADSAEQRTRERGLELLRLRFGESVLEIGPGTGQALVALAKAAGEAGRVCGLDVSAGMLRTARRRLAHEGAPAHLLRGDAQRLPLRSASFDAAFMSFTLELFDDSGIATVLAELRRVLRVGGRLVVVCLAAGARPSIATSAYAWLHRQLPHLLDCHPIPIRRHLARSGFDHRRSDAIRLWGLKVAVVLAVRRDD